MNIYSAEQIRHWDQYTIKNEPVTSLDLMERAAAQCSAWIIEHFAAHPFKIFCAKGNNGGDGLAIGRQLITAGLKAEIYILESGNPGSKDFQLNLERLHEMDVPVHYIQDESLFPRISPGYVLVECLYGTGLNRPVEGLTAGLINYINRSEAKIISIDIPGGMFADKSSGNNTVAKADYTLTFQVLKLTFLLPENQENLGEVTVLDIGLHKDYASVETSAFQTIETSFVQLIYKPRSNFSHKGSFGHALILAGSKGKMGACILTSKACLHIGAGMVSVAVPQWGMKVIQTAFPEAMAMPFKQLDEVNWETYSTIGLGPGLGTDEKVQQMVKKVLTSFKKPMVIDADGLNIIAKNKQWLNLVPEGSILTPHPKEFERLFGKASDDFTKLDMALKNAQSLKIYILIKGHRTFIACPDGQGVFNTTGNAGMATAGSGDVLTGILTGLLSQGYPPKHAALFGVYFHGLAGDIAAAKTSQEALIAGDIIEHLGTAYKKMYSK